LSYIHIRIYVLNYETKEELITLPVSRDCIDDVKVSPGKPRYQ